MSEWQRRVYDPDTDRDGLLFLLGESYTRSSAGRRVGAHKSSTSLDAVEKERSFVAAHEPIWLWLFENADVLLLVDPELPRIIWGWAITSSDNVMHAIGCKRNFTERDPKPPYTPPLSVDIARELLGDRLRRHQVCSLEFPQLRESGSGSIGLVRPREWSLDPTWLVTRMLPGRPRVPTIEGVPRLRHEARP